MNPFRPLLKLLDFVLGHDLREGEAEKKPPRARPPTRRSSASGGDGFERVSPGSRVDLGGGVKPAPKMPDEPAGPAPVIETTNFNASLDDLSHLVSEPQPPVQPLDFSHVVDAPLEAKPEFVPEGGVSTESLMREFESLDPTAQAAAVEIEAQKQLEQQQADEEGLPLPSGEGRGEGEAPAPPLAPPLPAPDFSHVVDTPLEAKPAFVPAGGMSTESLMSEFSSLDAETQAEAVTQQAAKDAARELEEQEEEEFEAPVVAPLPRGERQAVAPTMSTESLMGEFESLDAETQAAAVEQHAAREAARAEAEAKAAQEEQWDDAIDSFESAPPSAAPPSAAPLPVAPPPAAPPPAAPPPAVPPPATPTPSLDLAARAQAAKAAAAEAAAAAQAAAARAAEAQKLAEEAEAAAKQAAPPPPEPPKPDRLTPAWLVPATKEAAPKKPVPVSTGFNASLDDLEPEPQPRAEPPKGDEDKKD